MLCCCGSVAVGGGTAAVDDVATPVKLALLPECDILDEKTDSRRDPNGDESEGCCCSVHDALLPFGVVASPVEEIVAGATEEAAGFRPANETAVVVVEKAAGCAWPPVRAILALRTRFGGILLILALERSYQQKHEETHRCSANK